MGLVIVTFKSLFSNVCGVSKCYVWGLVFLRLGVSQCYVRRLVFLRLGDSQCYVWGLVFLRLRVSQSYLWGLVFLRLGVSQCWFQLTVYSFSRLKYNTCTPKNLVVSQNDLKTYFSIEEVM